MTLKTKDIVDKFADLPDEQRQGIVADALIAQIYEVMEKGEKWLRERIAFCERAA
jgi:hypothetical protein